MHNLVGDADQRLTEDLDMLCNEIANTFPDVIKPIADISWFSFQVSNPNSRRRRKKKGEERRRKKKEGGRRKENKGENPETKTTILVD